MVDQVALRIEMLEDALELIESQADGHKRSVAYNGGENIALVNVRNIARITLAESRSKGPAAKADDEVTIRLLQEALRRYGNRLAMSFAPDHLQNVIDEAMSFRPEEPGQLESLP
jgi:hypothetical protein